MSHDRRRPRQDALALERGEKATEHVATTMGYKPGVNTATFDGMLDWKSFAESIYSVVGRTILGERGVKFNISECQWISTLGTTDGVYHPGELYFKYTLDAATPWRKVKIFNPKLRG
ncbi:Uncharacterized protein PBTT_07170 [Plasmodiophora brassicae]